MKKLFFRTVIVSILVLFCTTAYCQDGGTQFDVGFTGGAWLPGTISIEGTDVDKDMGLLVRGIFDAYLMPNFAVGAYVNYFTGSLSMNDASLDVWFYEFGMALKPKFKMNEKMSVKPGLNIGYRLNDRESLGVGDDNTESDGLGLNLSVEIAYNITESYGLIFDVGFLSQPAGGNEDVEVTWAPIVYLNVGVIF